MDKQCRKDNAKIFIWKIIVSQDNSLKGVIIEGVVFVNPKKVKVEKVEVRKWKWKGEGYCDEGEGCKV